MDYMLARLAPPQHEILNRLNIGCLLALRTLRNLKRYFLTFFERFESRHADCREVRE